MVKGSALPGATAKRAPASQQQWPTTLNALVRFPTRSPTGTFVAGRPCGA
jgi:hypothetical protein